MDEIIQRLIRDHFSELAGLAIEATLPVSERLVTEIVGMAIRGNKTISYCRVAISRQNRISVNLKTPRWPWPLELTLRLERSVDVTRSPVLLAQLENKVLLGRLGSFFKALPVGVKLRGDQVFVDLRAFVREPEQRIFLEMVRVVEIKTEEGKAILDIRAGVDRPS